uniref:Uncharacterized protein n=1 Tax=Panagrolaimus superbus TaxID=310955 RepID=A0A914Z6L2_9BILA
MKKEVIPSNDETAKKDSISPPRSFPPPPTLTSTTSAIPTSKPSISTTTPSLIPSTSLSTTTAASTTTNDNVKIQLNDSRKKIEPYLNLVAMAEDLEAEDEKMASESKGGSNEKQTQPPQLSENKVGTEKKSNIQIDTIKK